MSKEKSPEHQARIAAGANAVQELAKEISAMSADEKDAALRVMSLIRVHGVKLGYKNICRPLNELHKELS